VLHCIYLESAQRVRPELQNHIKKGLSFLGRFNLDAEFNAEMRLYKERVESSRKRKISTPDLKLIIKKSRNTVQPTEGNLKWLSLSK
jgi:hypothetical protein